MKRILFKFYIIIFMVVTASLFVKTRVQAATVSSNSSNYLYAEGYIILGEGKTANLENAAAIMRDQKSCRIPGFESAVFKTPVGMDRGNLFFVKDGTGLGKAFVYADGTDNKGAGIQAVKAIMDANTGIRHWNILLMHGENMVDDQETVNDYLASYNHWINDEFPEANVCFMIVNPVSELFNTSLKAAFADKVIDFQKNYSVLTADGYKGMLTDILTEVRRIRVASYKPEEVGFIIMSECHSDILLWSIPYYLKDEGIVSKVPKVNLVPVSTKSLTNPDYFGGGVTVNYKGLDYEADSVINGLMKEHPNVKFWYMTYYAGTNYVRNTGAEGTLKYMRSNLQSIDCKDYYADHTIALLTTPPMYNRGDACERIVDKYDDGEMEHMSSIGYADYAYDTRDDFWEYVTGDPRGQRKATRGLKKVEFKGYRYGSSGDGLHFYGKQYWIVTTKAINEIYSKTRGEDEK